MLNIYRASAGSGKTYRLTQDYITLLLDPRREHVHRHVLAVTFTNKATDEMKNRILHELHALAQGAPSGYREELMRRYKMKSGEVDARARRVLTDILHDYSSFAISTIDRFFQQVIRAFARDIGVNGAYSLELDSNSMLEQAVDNLFLDLSKKENRQLLRWLTQLAEERVEQAQGWNMRREIVGLGREIFKENFQYQAEETSRKLHDLAFLDAYRRDLRVIKTDYEQTVKGVAAEALQIIAINGLSPADFKGGARSPVRTLEKLRRGNFRKVPPSFFALPDDLANCYTKTTPQDVRLSIETAYTNGLQQCLGRLRDLLLRDMGRYRSADIVLKHLNYLGVLADLAVQVKTLSEEQNALPISDTNMLLNRIIDESETPFVYERTGIRVNHYMIDEFQDTSVLQWRNFRPLLADSLAAGEFNLVVGDVKQSIYRWRNSDWKLLDGQVKADFRRGEVREEALETNWRSDRHIVHFNNAFFALAARVLQDKLNVALAPALAAHKVLKALQGRITHAYDHLHQRVSPRAGEGHVHFTFIPDNKNKEEWQAAVLDRLPALLESLQDRGYRPEDIALLVRKKEEEQSITRHLLHYKSSPGARPGYCYDVMSNEGLLVASAPSVRFLTGVLTLLADPSDDLARLSASYEYLRGRRSLSREDALNAYFSLGWDGVRLLPPLTDGEHVRLAALRHRPLYDLVEEVISLFDVGSWPGAAVFVQTFQDAVLRFASGKPADLGTFLRWWTRQGDKLCVPSPEGTHAMRIMTVHKSKGLDFPVVVIPFADWEMDSSHGDILWCSPAEAPFNRLPLLPVEYRPELAQSVFAPDYFNEQMHQYIDNLNVAYVAFTRAKHELIGFAPAPKKPVEGAEGVSSLATLLSACFTLSQEASADGVRLAEHYDAEAGELRMGAPVPSPDAAGEDSSAPLPCRYPVTDTARARLSIRHLGMDYWLEGQGLEDSRVNYGTVMHRVLQDVRCRGDEQRVVSSLVREGHINAREADTVYAALERFWALPHVDEWFAPDVRILTEATVLTPGGDEYRPDRVVLSGGRATVVDYKFGDSERPAYLQQVRRYVQLVRQMGYDTRGYVCYVTLGRVVEV